MFKILNYIKFWLVDKFWSIGSVKLNYDKEKNRKIIEIIESKLFSTGELKTDGTSSFCVLLRRTLAQFLGQKYWIASNWIYIIRYIISIFALPFCVLLPLIKGTPNSKILARNKRYVQVVAFLEVKFYRVFLDEIFPEGYAVASVHNMELHLEDIRFILKVLRTCPRYFMYPELIWRVIIRVSQYSSVIHQNHPKIISNFTEGSCWSSTLTAYCREFGIRHVNIMHGIRYFSSSMAFAEFDTFYVWGEYHLEQFKMMNVWAREFIISGNPIHRRLRKMVFSTTPKQSRKLLIMYEFFLLADKRLFSLVCEVVSQIGPEWEIACRLHYQEVRRSICFVERLTHKLEREVVIEQPGEVSIEDSIRKADVVVGCYTNAITDAWIAEKKCIYLHPGGNRIPLQEYHQSKNIKVFSQGDNIQGFLNTPIFEDESELVLKNRFSKMCYINKQLGKNSYMGKI